MFDEVLERSNTNVKMNYSRFLLLPLHICFIIWMHGTALPPFPADALHCRNV